MLPPVMFPVTIAIPPVEIFPAVKLPIAEIVVLALMPRLVDKLLASMSSPTLNRPGVEILLPLMLPTAPMLPVMSNPDCPNTATLLTPAIPTVTSPPALTTWTLLVPLDMEVDCIPVTPNVTVLAVALPVIEILLPDTNVTTSPTVLARIAVPLAEILPKLNDVLCWNAILLLPNTMGSSVVKVHSVSRYVLPSVTVTTMPDCISPASLVSVVRIQVPLDPVPSVCTRYRPFWVAVLCPFTSTLLLAERATPSTELGAPPVNVTFVVVTTRTACL